MAGLRQIRVLDVWGFQGKPVFENLEVGGRGGEMQVDRGSSWTHRVVRRDRNEVCLGNRCDLAHFQQPADDADIRLHDVAALNLEQLEEFVAAVEAFSGRQRAGDLLPDRAPGLEIFRTDRLLEDQRIVRRPRIAKLASLPWLDQLGVGVECEIELCRRDFPQSTEIVSTGADDLAPPLGMGVDAVGAELEGGKPVRLILLVDGV